MDKASKPVNEFDWARNQIQTYSKLYPAYEKYAKVLQEILEQAAKIYAPLAIVQARPKSVSSFGEKIWRKSNPSRDPVNEFTDLCGGRVITHTRSEILAFCNFIRNNFEIDWENSVDACQRLSPTEFGYRSVHYIVSIPKHFSAKDVRVRIPSSILGLKAEVQVRTLLEHAWADFSHDRSYKSQFDFPAKWQRELATIAANLEVADNNFVRIEKSLSTYASSYGAYMTKPEMQVQIKKLELVLEFDENNLEIAHRIGKLAMNLGDWQKAVEVLSKFASSKYQPILKDLGTSICQLYKSQPESPEYGKGQEYLKIACELSDNDSDAFASLAGTYRRKTENKLESDAEAKRLYFEAFKRDPSNSYPLGNYLDYFIAQNINQDSIDLISPILETAVQRCREQVEVGINVPWAYYDIGKFSLLLGNPYESLSYYSKAISTSSASWMISTTLAELNRDAKFWENKEGFQWIQKLLLLGLFIRTTNEVEKEDCLSKIKDLAASNGSFKLPVVIVAGKGNAKVVELEKYFILMQEGFREFDGTIISGGTASGVSGIVDEVAKKYKIAAVGYAPHVAKASVNNNCAYLLRYTQGKSFSALEPLQYWTDLIASGVEPAQVRLLGIDGGPIAAAEYRIALALGATVAIIEESGGEAAKILSDNNWAKSRNLICLPHDPETLHAFLVPAKPIVDLELREAVARAIHSQYRKTVTGSHLYSDPSMADWEKLPLSLRESNLKQADAIFQKLKRLKFSASIVTNRPIVLINFTQHEIDVMAEMEHGRWTAERLLAGWRKAETRSIKSKQSPDIVSWAKLPQEARRLDKEPIIKIPEFLSQVNIEIHRTK